MIDNDGDDNCNIVVTKIKKNKINEIKIKMYIYCRIEKLRRKYQKRNSIESKENQ